MINFCFSLSATHIHSQLASCWIFQIDPLLQISPHRSSGCGCRPHKRTRIRDTVDGREDTPKNARLPSCVQVHLPTFLPKAVLPKDAREAFVQEEPPVPELRPTVLVSDCVTVVSMCVGILSPATSAIWGPPTCARARVPIPRRWLLLAYREVWRL